MSNNDNGRNDLFHNPETEFTTVHRFLGHQHGAMDLSINNETLDLSMATTIIMEQQEEQDRNMNSNNSSMQLESSAYSSTDSESIQIKPIFAEQEPLENIPTITYEEMDESQVVKIGPNGTKILVNDFRKIRWTNVSIATRTLLEVVFGRQTLATHTLSGKASPAFLHLGRPVKRQLNPKKVEDIICYVRAVFNCSVKEIRMSITTKCADLARRRRD